MHVFQNSGITRLFKDFLYLTTKPDHSYAAQLKHFMDTGYQAVHILHPDSESKLTFTNGDDERLQRAWARENGLSGREGLEEILLAQIESSGADVFYNLDPVRFDDRFLKRLPGNVRSSVYWRAAPSSHDRFSAYDALVCNFPRLINHRLKQGRYAGWLAPAVSSQMSRFSRPLDARSIDVCFVGGYSQHHQNRANMVHELAALKGDFAVSIHLAVSRKVKIATALSRVPFSRLSLALPRKLENAAEGPIFGNELHSLIGKSKVVVNGAVDMIGDERGNMRCFEATGCGALLLSDNGSYPPGFVNGETMVTYSSQDSIAKLLTRLLRQWNEKSAEIAESGSAMVHSHYSKKSQWGQFSKVLGGI